MEPFDSGYLETPKELSEMKERIEAFARQQMTLYGPEWARAMFDAFLGKSRN